MSGETVPVTNISMPWEIPSAARASEDGVAEGLLDVVESSWDDPQPDLADTDSDESDGEGDESEDADEELGAEAEDSDDESDDDSSEDEGEVEDDGIELSPGEKVSIEELKKMGLRQADYTRKTQEVAKIRDEVSAERQRYIEKLKAAEQALAELGPPEPDWDTLRKENPAEYAAQREDQRKRQENLEKVRKAREAEEQKDFEAQREQFSHHVAEERTKLLMEVPEWQDAGKMQEAYQQMSQFVAKYGFSPDVLNEITDHRLVLIIKDAMEGRKIKAKGQEKLEAPKKAAKVLKPKGKKAPQSDSQKGKKSQDVRKNLDRLAKTGSERDTFTLIHSLID